MKRRERKWTKGKLLSEPEKHPVLALWAQSEVTTVMKKRKEDGLHFNDMRFLLCKDYKQIKIPPKGWEVFSEATLKKMREYNDYTILQKDLTKLCEIGFLKKASRGFYTHVESPVMRYIQDFSAAGRYLIGSTRRCDVVATEAFELSDEVEKKCGVLYSEIMEFRAPNFEVRILDFWKRVDSSKLDIQQKIILRNELYPFTQTERLKKLIKKECLISTKKGKEHFDVSPFKKRNAEKLKKIIDRIKKHSKLLGNYSVTYAIGMYSYPNLFTEDYIAKKGAKFLDEMEMHQTKLQSLLMEFAKPCYVLFAPKD
jgi:predicted transcriptional regulator